MADHSMNPLTIKYDGGKLQFLEDIYSLLTIGQSIIFVGTKRAIIPTEIRESRWSVVDPIIILVVGSGLVKVGDRYKHILEG